MKKVPFTPSLFLIAFALTGCATQPVSTAEAVPVPRERILSSEFLQQIEGSGTVIVKRDSGIGGSGCSARLFVDAKPTADLRTSERVVLHLPNGDHILSAQPNGLCGGGVVETRVRVTSLETATFRMGYGTAGDFTLSPTAF
jgi:type IV pilus biogenesis protein CpaD/CtpE